MKVAVRIRIFPLRRDFVPYYETVSIITVARKLGSQPLRIFVSEITICSIEYMKKLLLSLLTAMTLMSLPAYAQRSTTSDYNYRKAIEAYYEDKDPDKALEFVNDVLDDTPDHLDSRFLRSKIYWHFDKYDAALRDVTYAIKNYKGKPLVHKSTLYGLRGSIYADMDRDAEAAKDYQMAAKLAKKDNQERVQDYTFDYAQALYNSDDIAGAEKVYFQMLKADPGDCAAMVGLARNYLSQEKYDEAMKYIKEAESYDESYSQIYRFKMQILDKMGKTDECVDAALKYVETDDDAPMRLIAKYAGKHYTYAVAKIKAEMNNQNASGNWIALLTILYENHHDFAKAIELYDKAENEYGANATLYLYRSDCYKEMGEYQKAIKDLTKAIEIAPDEEYFKVSRGDVYRNAGMYEKAIADYTACIEKDPLRGYYYYARGWSYELSGDDAKALEDYNTGIDLDKDYPYLFLNRAEQYKKQGKTELANADYEMVMAKDTIAKDGSCRHYALHGLGRDEEAIEWMDKIIEDDPNDAGHWYDKACLYVRMGRTDEALEALETAFKKGLRKFAHLERDADMNPLRDLPEYKALIKQYKGKTVEETSEEVAVTPEAAETLISEIQMKKTAGGTYEIPCSINGLPLKFIFDTGASEVTISSVEANFMLKNDYLTTKDFKGSRKYLTADGNITEGAVIRIREVQVGDVTLKNIEASVVKNQKASLLFGQSVLERFGSITIDNTNSKLIIKHQ